jgi:hypothetical protein
MIENIKYNWTSIKRYYCKEGYIDTWSGDMGSDPDDKAAPKLNLNACVTLYRFNDGDWANRLSQSIKSDLYDDTTRELFTAEEIFKQ